MRFGIQTWGSEGDIDTLLALGSGLKASGHDVTMAISSIVNKDYRSVCEKQGLKYLQVSEPITIDHANFLSDPLQDHIPSFDELSLKWFQKLLETTFFPYQEDMYRAALQLCQQSDAVIAHSMLYPMKAAALNTGTPYISVTLTHHLIPTRSRPPSNLPDLGTELNPRLWKYTMAGLDLALQSPLQKFWVKKGLVPFQHVQSLWTSERLNLVAVSPIFCGQELDWENRHSVCGFMNTPTAQQNWQMPQPLQQFLEAGSPPVCMTFGSLQQMYPGTESPEASIDLLVETARRLNCRALIQTIPTTAAKYPANTCDAINQNIFFIGWTPYEHIFPQCVAVVHHGGARTMQLATQSYCPSIVVPFTGEHLFWANELHRVGLSPTPIPRTELTVADLADRIQEVLQTPSFSKQATQLGEKMRQENGVAQAIEKIESNIAIE